MLLSRWASAFDGLVGVLLTARHCGTTVFVLRCTSQLPRYCLQSEKVRVADTSTCSQPAALQHQQPLAACSSYCRVRVGISTGGVTAVGRPLPVTCFLSWSAPSLDATSKSEDLGFSDYRRWLRLPQFAVSTRVQSSAGVVRNLNPACHFTVKFSSSSSSSCQSIEMALMGPRGLATSVSIVARGTT